MLRPAGHRVFPDLRGGPHRQHRPHRLLHGGRLLHLFHLTRKFGLQSRLGACWAAILVVTLLGLLAYKLFIDPIREHEARRPDRHHRPGHGLSGGHAADLHRGLPERAVPDQGILHDPRGQGLLSAVADLRRGAGDAGSPLVPVDEDQTGPGHPLHGRGPGGGQSDGHEREPAWP